MALSHTEVMSYELLIITTPNCETLVRSGIEGFIVPIHNAKTLADHIQKLLEDRTLRLRMSRAARSHAVQYSRVRHGERLVAAFGVTRRLNGITGWCFAPLHPKS